MKCTLVLIALAAFATSKPLFKAGVPGSGCLIIDGINCDSVGLETSGERPIREGSAPICKQVECEKSVRSLIGQTV